MKKASTPQNDEREQPHSAEMEKGVLGSIFQSAGKVIPECVEKIQSQFFFVPAHRTIYQALLDVHDSGDAIDLITFTQRLRDKKILAAVGGAAYLTELQTFVPTDAAIAYYLESVRDKYILRETIATCTESARRALEAGDQNEPLELLDQVESRIASIRSLGRNGVLPGQSVIDLAEMDQEIFAKESVMGIGFFVTLRQCYSLARPASANPLSGCNRIFAGHAAARHSASNLRARSKFCTCSLRMTKATCLRWHMAS